MAARTRETDPEEYDPSTEREISLGTPAILGIFFALSLVCAGFFGFGYILGRKSIGNSAPSGSATTPTATLFNSPKPAAGSPVGPLTAAKSPSPSSEPQIVTQTLPADPTPSPSSNSSIAPSDRIIAGDKPPAAAPQPAANNQQPPAGSFVVQVAAVSSQEVADILLASLQKKGYSVAVHQEPQDKLLHVQIGPFATRPAAEAMRQRVIADGFNAIVK